MKTLEKKRAGKSEKTERLILRCALSPGDVLTMTAAVESLHRQFPGRYLTDVRTPCPAIWENNPLVTPLRDERGRIIEMHYPSIGQCNQTHTPFLGGYTEYLGTELGISLKLQTNRPHLYLSDQERVWVDQVTQHFMGGRRRPFWLINAGVKWDYTAKQWPVEHYQEVVDRTRGLVQWVQIGESSHRHHRLRGALDLVGKTDLRQLIRLAYHSQGGLGPVTLLQHLLAAWEKPYLCLLGGREPLTWVTYPLQHTFHSLGLLDCCRTQACWKSRVQPLEDGDRKDLSLCAQPILGLLESAPRCLAMIRPGEVAALIERLLVQ